MSHSTAASTGTDASHYGDHCAEFYDELYVPPSVAQLELLMALARGGPVLDAGSGTGRLLLALAQRGIPVQGIDVSHAMVQAMRAKAGGESIPVTIGDFSAITAPGGPFELVVCVVNTLALLPNESIQRDAVARLAGVLSTTGRLLIETSITEAAAPRHTDVTVLTRIGMRRYSASLCPIAPDSLDRFANEAGLALDARWCDWSRRPYQPGATSAISIYRRDDLAPDQGPSAAR
jgi:SAM-dependent methyltransferase